MRQCYLKLNAAPALLHIISGFITSLINIQQPNNTGALIRSKRINLPSLLSGLWNVTFFVLDCTLSQTLMLNKCDRWNGYIHINPNEIHSKHHFIWMKHQIHHCIWPQYSIINPPYARAFRPPLLLCSFVKYFELYSTLWPWGFSLQTFLHTNVRAFCSSLRSEGRTSSRNKT
jgi:hypothetical protein